MMDGAREVDRELTDLTRQKKGGEHEEGGREQGQRGFVLPI